MIAKVLPLGPLTALVPDEAHQVSEVHLLVSLRGRRGRAVGIGRVGGVAVVVVGGDRLGVGHWGAHRRLNAWWRLNIKQVWVKWTTVQAKSVNRNKSK